MKLILKIESQIINYLQAIKMTLKPLHIATAANVQCVSAFGIALESQLSMYTSIIESRSVNDKFYVHKKLGKQNGGSEGKLMITLDGRTEEKSKDTF